MKMKEKDKKAYERNVKKLEYILKHPQVNTVLTAKKKDLLNKAFAIMKVDMESKQEGAEARGEEKSVVKECLNIILSCAINLPITPILRDLGCEFGLLAFNWNKAFAKRDDITATCRDVKSIIEGILSLKQVVEVSKVLLKELKEMKRFAPPVFQLSRAYLKSLLPKEEKKKDDISRKRN